jgi:predicted aspartyl protease
MGTLSREDCMQRPTIAMICLVLIAGLGLTGAAPPPSTSPPSTPPAPPAPAPGGLAIAPGAVVTPPDPTQPSKTLGLAADAAARLTLPVMVDGQGPFDFVIDTAAERTVLSRELAAAAHLPEGPKIVVRGAAGDEDAPSAAVRALRVGERTIRDVDAPLLAAADLGAAGMLGIDALKDQHVVLDFEHHRMTSSHSRKDPEEAGAIVVRGQYRFGQLILVDAHIRNVVVYVILDTGAQTSIGNDVLRRMLTTGDPARDQFLSTKVISVTGQTVPADYEIIPSLEIGSLEVKHLPLAFARLHTFEIYGLGNRPALLLGMDILGKFRRVTIDFKRREVSFSTFGSPLPFIQR